MLNSLSMLVGFQEEQLEIRKESVELALERNVHDIILSLTNQISNIQISKISAEAAKLTGFDSIGS